MSDPAGQFGSYHKEGAFGVKRYEIKEGGDACELSAQMRHAVSERQILQDLTDLSNEFEAVKYLGNHIAKFDDAWLESKQLVTDKKAPGYKKEFGSAVACLRIQHCAGGDLHDAIFGGESSFDPIAMSIELIQAFALVHGVGMAHRDLKPDNVMLKKEGEHSVLIDWGNSIFVEDGDRETEAICGTRRANAWQVLALEAKMDKIKISPELKAKIFKKGQAEGFCGQKNDLVGLAHILCYMWSSVFLDTPMGAFGASWDVEADKDNVKVQKLLKQMEKFYSEDFESFPYDLFIPAPLNDIVRSFVQPKEEDRMTALEAWELIWERKDLFMNGEAMGLPRGALKKPPTQAKLNEVKTVLRQRTQRAASLRDQATNKGRTTTSTLQKEGVEFTVHQMVSIWESKCSYCAENLQDCLCAEMSSSSSASSTRTGKGAERSDDLSMLSQSTEASLGSRKRGRTQTEASMPTKKRANSGASFDDLSPMSCGSASTSSSFSSRESAKGFKGVKKVLKTGGQKKAVKGTTRRNNRAKESTTM